jgi:hypothetical protein
MKKLQIAITVLGLMGSATAHADSSFFNSLNEAAGQIGDFFGRVQSQARDALNQYYGDGSSNPPVFAPSPALNSPSPAPVVAPPEDPMFEICRNWGIGGEADTILQSVVSDESTDTTPDNTRAECMTWAIDHGAHLQSSNSGLQPLIMAITMLRPDLAKILIDRGADPNVVDENGMSALFWAAFTFEDDVVVVLLEKNANPNVGDADHAAPLFAALNIESPASVKALLDHGANPNVTFNAGSDQEVPLASATDRLETIQMTADEIKNEQTDSSLTMSDLDVKEMQSDYSYPHSPQGQIKPPRTPEQIVSDAKQVVLLPDVK